MPVLHALAVSPPCLPFPENTSRRCPCPCLPLWPHRTSLLHSPHSGPTGLISVLEHDSLILSQQCFSLESFLELLFVVTSTHHLHHCAMPHLLVLMMLFSEIMPLSEMILFIYLLLVPNLAWIQSFESREVVLLLGAQSSAWYLIGTQLFIVWTNEILVK